MEQHGGRIGYLDGWRGCAILFVLLGHFVRGRAFWCGPFGVELFFALSGALMADILLVRQVALPRFFARRLSRVYPALAVFVACMAALSFRLAHYGRTDDLHVTGAAALAALTFTSNVYMLATQTQSIVGHSWSLCVEETAYVVLAIIAAATGRRLHVAGRLCLIVAMVAMADGLLCYLLTDHRQWADVYWRSDVRLSSVLLPVALFALARDRLTAPAIAPLGLAIAALTFAYAPVPFHYIVGTTALGIAVTALPTTYRPIRDALSATPLRAVGIVSFSLYLWQQPFWYWASLRPALTVPYILTCLALTLASYWLIEDPVRRAINERLGDHRRRAAPTIARGAEPAL